MTSAADVSTDVSTGVAQAEQRGLLRVHVRGIGLIGPGLLDWTAAAQALADGATAWSHAPTIVPTAARLPPAERRRAGDIVKLSLAVADQACQSAGADPSDLATVFSASTGDAKNCHALCEALALPDHLVSPTRFTNSVHNASAGYWHIACASRAPSTSLCAFDGSFCAGLLEAAVQCVREQRPVLLVTADVPYPEPLHGVRPISETMAVALLLDCEPGEPGEPGEPDEAGAQLPVRLALSLSARSPTTCADQGLESLRLAAPVGRALPLLEAMADHRSGTVILDYLDGRSLAVHVMHAATGPGAEDPARST